MKNIEIIDFLERDLNKVMCERFKDKSKSMIYNMKDYKEKKGDLESFINKFKNDIDELQLMVDTDEKQS